MLYVLRMGRRKMRQLRSCKTNDVQEESYCATSCATSNIPHGSAYAGYKNLPAKTIVTSEQSLSVSESLSTWVLHCRSLTSKSFTTQEHAIQSHSLPCLLRNPRSCVAAFSRSWLD